VPGPRSRTISACGPRPVHFTCGPPSGEPTSHARIPTRSSRSRSAAAGYAYGSKAVDRREQVAEIRAGLPTVEHVVHVPYGENTLPDSTPWTDLLAEPADLAFDAVPFARYTANSLLDTGARWLNR